MTDIFSKIKRPAPKAAEAPPPRNEAGSALDRASAGRQKRDPALQEVFRICQLPMMQPLVADEVEAFSEENVLAAAFAEGFRLKPKQAEALMAYDELGGAFLPLRVGAGKSLISLMVAQRGYAKGIKKSIVMVPSQVYNQLTTRDIPWARRHVPISVPFMKLGQVPAKKRALLANSNKSGCYILPYSLLSVEDTDELLDAIRPGLIILDEGHNLKNYSAARTGRVFGRHGYLNRYQNSDPREERPEMVVMSGTITAKSLLDYWHLLKECLRDSCPLPLNGHLVRKWAGVLDSDASRSAEGYGRGENPDEDKARTDTLMPLVRWAQENFPDQSFPETTRGFRTAFRRRFETCPGVVASGAEELGVSLVFRNEVPKVDDSYPGFKKLQELIREVDKGTAPNGDAIDHAMNAYGWHIQLSAGFYNDLYWPEPEKFAKERDIDLEQAVDILDRAQLHHTVQQLYHSQMRKWLSRRARPGLDTPFLVASDMDRHGKQHVGPDLYEAWREMHEHDFEGRPKRRSRPVRVCDFRIQQALAWIRKLPKGRGALLWHMHKEVGRWLHEAATKAGLETVLCPAGHEGNKRITAIGDYELGGKGDKVTIASISGHGTGKNLPAFEEQFVIQWPRSPVQSEQMLGRCHRHGQRADSLTIHTCNFLEIDDTNFAAAMNDACYIQETTGSDQKLMMASFETPPAVISSSELKRRGVRDIQMLSGRQIQLLAEKFGT